MVKLIYYKIRNIIVGNFRNLIGYTSDETKRRRQICKKCSSRIKYLGVYVCEHCGCPIKSKTTVESEKCLMNKW